MNDLLTRKVRGSGSFIILQQTEISQAISTFVSSTLTWGHDIVKSNVEYCSPGFQALVEVNTEFSTTPRAEIASSLLRQVAGDNIIASFFILFPIVPGQCAVIQSLVIATQLLKPQKMATKSLTIVILTQTSWHSREDIQKTLYLFKRRLCNQWLEMRLTHESRVACPLDRLLIVA